MHKLSMRCAVIVSVALFSFQAGAADPRMTPSSDRELPGVVVGAGQTATATVTAVNPETREFTIREEDGELFTLIAGEDVRNFDQVEVGDLVVVRQQIGMVMQLSPSKSGLRERTDRVEVGRAEPGQKPAGIIRKTVEAVVTVVALDAQERTVTLKGPLRTVTLPVSDDINLDAIEVGDEVDAIYQESLAISVEPAPAGR